MRSTGNSKFDILRELYVLRAQLFTQKFRSNNASKAQEELTRLFTQSLDLLCIAGTDGYFKRLNPAWTKQLGWPIDELLVKPFLEFVHPQDRVSTVERMNSLLVGEQTILFENRYLHRNGTYRWLQWNATPEPATDLIYAAARDITRQRELEKEVLEISDRAKEHLGQELHDGLSQTLAGIAALSMTLSRTLKQKSRSDAADIAASDSAAEIARLLGDAVRDARDLARGLKPVELVEHGLDDALEVLSANVEHLFRVQCTFSSRQSNVRLRTDIATHLFRITQEAVNNAVLHGPATRVNITMDLNGTDGRLSVCDDGGGMTSSPIQPTGMGINSMKYRARLIGGKIEFTSNESHGVCVSCLFPVVQAPLMPHLWYDSPLRHCSNE